MQSALEKSTNVRFLSAIVAAATLGGFMFGYDSGVINGTQQGLEQAFHLSTFGTGINVGAILVGCAAGALAAGWLADRIGRRLAMIVAAILFLISALATGAAASSAMFICARIVGGLGVGAASVLAPAYVSEVAPAKYRGRLASAQQIMIICGLTGAFLSNYLLSALAGSSTAPLWLQYPAWRWMFWLQAAPASLFLFSLLAIPESPRFLIAAQRREEAREILTRLMGPVAAEQKAAEIIASFKKDHRPRLADLRGANRRVRPIVWVGVGLGVLQQLVGINIVFYYGAALWQSVGFTEDDALRINILSGVSSIASCLVSIALIDRLGRRPLLMIGSLGMAVTLGLVSWSFSSGTSDGQALHLADGPALIALVAANAYVAFFNFSWGPVTWVLLGEMFPNQIRGSALGLAGAAQWTTNFMISVSFPAIASAAGLAATYSLYALAAATSLIFAYLAVPETRGRELEAMPE